MVDYFLSLVIRYMVLDMLDRSVLSVDCNYFKFILLMVIYLIIIGLRNLVIVFIVFVRFIIMYVYCGVIFNILMLYLECISFEVVILIYM